MKRASVYAGRTQCTDVQGVHLISTISGIKAAPSARFFAADSSRKSRVLVSFPVGFRTIGDAPAYFGERDFRLIHPKAVSFRVGTLGHLREQTPDFLHALLCRG